MTVLTNWGFDKCVKGRAGWGVSYSAQASQRSLMSFARIRSIQYHSHEKNAWKLISAAHCSGSRKKKFPFLVIQKRQKMFFMHFL